MEVVEMGGYTEAEKLNIVRKFLLPKQEEENGLKKGFLDVSDEDIMYLIRHYTREAGLRNLERKIASVCRKVTTEIVEKTRDKKHNTISQKDIVEFLGPEVYSDDAFNQQDEIGISTGLGWSPSGGSTLLLETVMMKGKGNLKLTGKLGDVMKESAETAFSYIKAHANKYDIDESLFEN
ncbi:MAG: S16 family serine protease, partial [Patescibacteria group bacterium]|nr:S16 family serine protease [Patescibacteria group bacterium]